MEKLQLRAPQFCNHGCLFVLLLRTAHDPGSEQDPILWGQELVRKTVGI